MKTITTFTTILLSGFLFLIPAQKSKNNDLKNTNNCKKATRKSLKETSPHFIQFGIMSINHDPFKKKYGITVNYQNCVVSKYLSEKAKENNQLVAQTLTKKYGSAWKKDLGFIPYGL